MAGPVLEMRSIVKTFPGVKVVPSYLLVPLEVDKTNWEAAVVESGYYTKDQIQ